MRYLGGLGKESCLTKRAVGSRVFLGAGGGCSLYVLYVPFSRTQNKFCFNIAVLTSQESLELNSRHGFHLKLGYSCGRAPSKIICLGLFHEVKVNHVLLSKRLTMLIRMIFTRSFQLLFNFHNNGRKRLCAPS